MVKNWTPDDIKALRKRMNLSQPAFGARLGVTGNYIYLLEKGVKEASDTLKLLLDCVQEKETLTKHTKRKEVLPRHGKRNL